MSTVQYNSAQEEFWAGEFGDSYIRRNESKGLLASNINFFAKSLRNTSKISSCVEFGANIGMNLKALQLLVPDCTFKGVEINRRAADILGETIGAENVTCGSILDYEIKDRVDLSLTKGVLIHIDPERLPAVYDKIHAATKRYILVCEYYNPTPVAIPYRGHTERLFKRDFAGEILDRFGDLALIDYGFAYSRDLSFPQDDITWFLMEKR